MIERRKWCKEKEEEEGRDDKTQEAAWAVGGAFWLARRRRARSSLEEAVPTPTPSRPKPLKTVTVYYTTCTGLQRGSSMLRTSVVALRVGGGGGGGVPRQYTTIPWLMLDCGVGPSRRRCLGSGGALNTNCRGTTHANHRRCTI